jgi:hypothetical protein
VGKGKRSRADAAPRFRQKPGRVGSPAGKVRASGTGRGARSSNPTKTPRADFDRIIEQGGFITAPTGGPRDANLILVPKVVADAAMDAALAANCAPAFFRAARHAVQERLAQRWKLPVSQVTVTEINRRLNSNGDDLRALFAFADGVVYSGQRVLPEDLKRWKDTVIQHLKKLEDL